MRNYLKNYSGYFLIMGIVLLLMFFFGLTPSRFRNAPTFIRIGFPVVFIFLGYLGIKYKKQDSE
jgi:hypothetical protein